MAKIEIFCLYPQFSVNRAEDGQVVLTIVTGVQGGDVILINVGDNEETASTLHEQLDDTSAHLAREILDGWQDTPDPENDGWVSFYDGKYSVSLGRPRDITYYPTMDIAVYELAALMAEAGYFPNAWYQNSRGITENIDTRVRAFHDEGGDKMLPLAGVEYQPGDQITYGPGDAAPGIVEPRTVVRDYGAMGIILDGEYRTYVSGESRDEWQQVFTQHEGFGHAGGPSLNCSTCVERSKD